MPLPTFDQLAPWVIGFQLTWPLLLGGPFLFSARLQALMSTRKRAELHAERAAATEDASRQGRLAALQCPSCSAPVALDAESFACPHCGAQVTPPPEYVSALRDRRRAEEELTRAVRMWRLSRWTSAAPLLWLARLTMVSWTLFACFCALGKIDSDESWTKAVAGLVGLVGLISAGVGWVLTTVIADERAAYPRVPARSSFSAAVEDAGCTSCGAPVHFPANTLATICTYCRGENYRAAVARAERQGATRASAAAHTSLVAALRAHEERRADIFCFLGFLAVAEVFFAVFFLISTISDAIFG